MKLKTKFILWFFLMAFMLIPCIASAFDLGKVNTFGFHTVSHHEPWNGANNINLGGFVATDKGFVAGGYYNSWDRMAYYAGWSTPEWHRIKASVIGVTGYFEPVTFLVIPSVKLYQGNKWSAWISGSPVKITQEGQSVLHLSFAWEI